jgi:exosortase
MIQSTPWSERQTWILMGAVLAAVLWLYLPILMALFADWGVNDDYSHGYFIPFLVVYFIYCQRDELKNIAVRTSNSGILVIAAGLAQLVIAKIGSEFFLQRTSMIILLIGLVLFLLGWEYLRKLFLPLAYLIFMIPLPAIIWNKIAFPMQLFSSFLTEKVISLLGIPIFREGNILHLAETTLEVVAACSGLRSLVTMFALSAALVLLSDLSIKKKWVLFFSAAPIAIFANITRLTVTAILASKYGSAVAQGFLHEFSGIVVFFIGLGLLVGFNSILGEKKLMFHKVT